jgi:Fe-S-cluster containining protein
MKAEQCGVYSLDLPPRARTVPPEVRRVLAGYQDKMAGYLFRISRLDGLDGLASDHTLPRRFLTYMQKVMELCDDSNRYFVHYLRRSGRSIQCRPGCAHCCRNMPAGTSLAEFLYFYHGMHQSGVFSRLFRRCLEAEECLAQLFLQCQGKEKASPATPSTSACPEEILALYQDSGQPCRFSQGDLCQLYPFRPFVCRMHFSLTPSYWCDPEHFQFPHAVIVNLEPGACVYDALDRIEQRLRIKISGILAGGLLELTVNVMQFAPIHWSS